MNARKGAQTDLVLHAYFDARLSKATPTAGHPCVQPSSGSTDRAEQSDRAARAGENRRREALEVLGRSRYAGGDPAYADYFALYSLNDPKGLPAFYAQISNHDLRSVLQHISAASAGDLSGTAPNGPAPVATMESKRRTYYRATGIKPPNWGDCGYQPTTHVHTTNKVHGEPTITARISR